MTHLTNAILGMGIFSAIPVAIILSVSWVTATLLAFLWIMLTIAGLVATGGSNSPADGPLRVLLCAVVAGVVVFGGSAWWLG